MNIERTPNRTKIADWRKVSSKQLYEEDAELNGRSNLLLDIFSVSFTGKRMKISELKESVGTGARTAGEAVDTLLANRGAMRVIGVGLSGLAIAGTVGAGILLASGQVGNALLAGSGALVSGAGARSAFHKAEGYQKQADTARKLAQALSRD